MSRIRARGSCLIGLPHTSPRRPRKSPPGWIEGTSSSCMVLMTRRRKSTNRRTAHGIPARAPSRGQSLTGSDARWRGGEALCICSTTADRILSSVIDGPAICAICWPRPRPSEPHAQVEPRHEIRVQVDVAAANPHVLSEGHQIEEELGRQGDPRGHGIVDPDPDGDQE
jgi:hypothetical protein